MVQGVNGASTAQAGIATRSATTGVAEETSPLPLWPFCGPHTITRVTMSQSCKGLLYRDPLSIASQALCTYRLIHEFDHLAKQSICAAHTHRPDSQDNLTPHS